MYTKNGIEYIRNSEFKKCSIINSFSKYEYGFFIRSTIQYIEPIINNFNSNNNLELFLNKTSNDKLINKLLYYYPMFSFN